MYTQNVFNRAVRVSTRYATCLWIHATAIDICLQVGAPLGLNETVLVLGVTRHFTPCYAVIDDQEILITSGLIGRSGGEVITEPPVIMILHITLVRNSLRREYPA